MSVPGAADGSSADSSAAHVDRRRTRNLLWKSTTNTSSYCTLSSVRLHDLGKKSHCGKLFEKLDWFDCGRLIND